MADQRRSAGMLSVVVVALVAGIVGAILGSLIVPRLTGTNLAQTTQRTDSPPTVQIQPSPTVKQIQPTATATVTPMPTATSVPDVEERTVHAVQVNRDSVVTIVASGADAADGATVPAQAIGSGVVFESDGYIVTNEHLVRNAESLLVILPDGREIPGERVGTDEFTDLAVVKVDAHDLAPASFGDSSALLPGQRVIAIGSALGAFRDSVTVGVVSGLGRHVVPTDREYALQDLIQIDAAINRGNSGGPLLNVQGEVIGVNTILVRHERTSDEVIEGINFTIPSETVREVVPQLITSGHVRRPYAGLVTRIVTADVEATYALRVDQGARVEEVVPGSPADTAGLRRGDVVLAVDDLMIDEELPFPNALMRYAIGDTVELHIDRVGEPLTLTITLEETPAR
jgi:S1-C subfamily serine protease